MSTNNKNIKFNVIEFDINSMKHKSYDVVPYFTNIWNDKKWDSFEKSKVKTKEDFKQWVIRASHYQFWARCEYECLIAPWPLGSYRIKEKLKEIDMTKIDENFIDITNAFTLDMDKIDVYEQIMMNIDIVTEILWNKFGLDKKKSAKK